jgi:endonuclease-3
LHSYAALESLPGVGHKTASVLMSQSFGRAAIAVDTHVLRLAGRWGLSREGGADRVQRDLMGLFPEEHWNKLHLQMIYFGREYCTAKDHSVSQSVLLSVSLYSLLNYLLVCQYVCIFLCVAEKLSNLQFYKQL